ncbi:hypothetical protein NCCP2716_17170 [Sporosarcina sp. NCCP-2716]|uniref:hypothetical protein n=1 Tax=Sporosarcina sp. NCCP-2716 TaxID=2943679 RepID=UPI0020403FB3|nr:hypothetical protein [Sporosarcina sp. NCCP-2716]GKV69219.1 hypothetical protein NCCP2716_17170 [Sporosarcina sp. NCCP-2716]
MEFIEYLRNRHSLQRGAKKLSDVSSDQYANRLHNLLRKGIYNKEKEITDEILRMIENEYKRGIDLYPRTIRYYIEFMAYEEYLHEGSLLSLSNL